MTRMRTMHTYIVPLADEIRDLSDYFYERGIWFSEAQLMDFMHAVLEAYFSDPYGMSFTQFINTHSRDDEYFIAANAFQAAVEKVVISHGVIVRPVDQASAQIKNHNLYLEVHSNNAIRQHVPESQDTASWYEGPGRQRGHPPH